MAPMTRAFVAEIQDFVDRHGLDLVHFAKDQRKDDLFDPKAKHMMISRRRSGLRACRTTL